MGKRFAGLAVTGLLILLASFASSVATATAVQALVLSPGARTSHAASGPSLSTAPRNPAFTSYLRLRSMARLHGLGQQDLGLVPSPIDFSYLRGARAPLTATAYPSSYDLRSRGKLSPIEDQGNYGACWTFASLGSLESCLLPADAAVFSEDNLMLTSGFSLDAYNGGGTVLMATAALARWQGPVAASEEGYGGSYVPPGLIPEKHIQNVDFLPSSDSALDNDWIKWALMNYGAVYSSFYADSSLGVSSNSSTWNARHSAYCYSGSQQPNHAVDIVGWDDAYSRSNFSTAPPGDGAFIVRNSWGTSFGIGGYFYVSYYDSQMAFLRGYPPVGRVSDTNAVFDGAQPTGNYNAIYQCDPLGWTDSSGYSSDTALFLNQFTARSSDQLTAVSFYAAEPGSSYTLYADTAPGTTMTAEGSGSFTAAGYHTVSLSSPIQLTSGQDFQVAVRLTTPGYNYPIPEESRITGYSNNVTFSNRSFRSADGITWDAMTDGNVCLKAFTRAAGSTDLTAPATSVTGVDGNWHRLPVALTFSPSDVGSQTAYTQFDVDRAGWQRGSAVTVQAPVNHSNDGSHIVLYRSVDNAGNVEATHACTVSIDTSGPACASKNATVKRGKSCKLYFKVHDRLSPKVTNVLTITTKSGVVKKRWSWGYDKNSTGWWWTKYACRLARGTYYLRVYGQDLAGNSQSVVGKAYLRVK